MPPILRKIAVLLGIVFAASLVWMFIEDTQLLRVKDAPAAELTTGSMSYRIRSTIIQIDQDKYLELMVVKFIAFGSAFGLAAIAVSQRLYFKRKK